MDSTLITEIENPTLTALLTELAQVFQERDDFRDEVVRLQEQYAEANEVAYDRGVQLRELQALADKRYHEIGELQARLQDSARDFQRVSDAERACQLKLSSQNYLFGEVLAHPPVGPGRKNRPKLTSAQVGGIRSMVGNGSTIASVAKVYGVHPSTVSRIASGVYHKGEEHA